MFHIEHNSSEIHRLSLPRKRYLSKQPYEWLENIVEIRQELYQVPFPISLPIQLHFYPLAI